MILHILPRSPVIICELVIFTGFGTLSTLDMTLFTAAFSISNLGVEISLVFGLFSVLTIGFGCFGVCRRTERLGSGLPPIFWSKFRRILPLFMGAGVPGKIVRNEMCQNIISKYVSLCSLTGHILFRWFLIHLHENFSRRTVLCFSCH